jgi:hypothetical protein
MSRAELAVGRVRVAAATGPNWHFRSTGQLILFR